MKFVFDREKMCNEIAVAQEIITNKSPISILSNVLLIAENNTLTIKATDTAVNYISQIPVEVIEEGSTTIYCDKFMSILSSLPPGKTENERNIEFIQDDIKVTIKPTTKKISFKLKSMSSEKFMNIPSAQNLPFFEISSKDFKDMIIQTIFSISDDPNRFFLTGVFLTKENDKLVMVSTDARRLSYCEKQLGSDAVFENAIVPTKILKSILKNAPNEGNISIAIVEKMIFVRFLNHEFSSKLIEGTFPNYRRVIPDYQPNNFKITKSDLDSAMKRAEILIDKKVGKIEFNLKKSILEIKSPETEQSIGTVDEEIPCFYDGKDITLAFNDKFIIEPLKSIDTNDIVFEFSEALRAVTIRPEPAKDYFHIVMPMN